MDSTQKSVLSAVFSGHNVVVLGQAGTGKTHTVKECVRQLRARGKNVSLTCYTGIACLQYEKMSAVTLHSFAGLEDGRHSNDRLVQQIMSDERFIQTKSRLQETEVLFIDEVSMVSCKVLESVEYVLRKVRANNTCFGGLQVVLSGDFYQLPPIKDELYGDSGQYCFESKYLWKCFPHIIKLENIHRQTELSLIKCVSELALGCPSEETNSFLSKLTRPLPDSVKSQTVKLFARNLDVDLHNYEMIQTVPGEIKVFEAEDFGDVFYLKKMLAPKKLALKVSAKVMLLKNISEQLVNGLIGTVVEVRSDCIIVKVPIGKDFKIAKICRYNFTKFDPVRNACLARRYQFPLKLAYSITIHKSQGMSLPYVEIDCSNATFPGQIGVAVGRAVSSDGLRVINYRPYMCKQHPKAVNVFYETLSGLGQMCGDLSCCRIVCNETVLQVSAPPDEDFRPDSGFLLNSLDVLENQDKISSDHTYSMSDIGTIGETADSDHSYCVSESFHEAETAFKVALEDYLNTPEEQLAQRAFEQLLFHKQEILLWYQDQCVHVEELYNDSCTAPGGSLKQKHFTDFYTSFNRYITSKDFENSSEVLLKEDFSQQLLTSVLFVIQKQLLLAKSMSVEVDSSTLSILPKPEQEMTAAGRGKIRYVGGYCIAKIRYRLCRLMRGCLFTPGLEEEITIIQRQIKLLDSMTVTASAIMECSIYENTLEEIARKQNICESLTNISDTVFEFFTVLEISCRSAMTYDTLRKDVKHMYVHVMNTVLSDNELFVCFVQKCLNYNSSAENATDNESVNDLCNEITSICDSVLVIYEKVVRLFVTVVFAQFRKDYLRIIKREKSKSLRKKVLEKKASKTVETVSINVIKSDQSLGKTVSHLKLKALALSNSTFYMDYKKAELQLLLKAYGLKYSVKSTKKQLGEILHAYLTNEDTLIMVNPAVIDSEPKTQSASGSKPGTCAQGGSEDPQPSTSSEPRQGTSGLQEKRKHVENVSSGRRSKRKKRCEKDQEQADDSEDCGICSKSYVDGEFWISCDSCSLWYHRDCVGLESENDWLYFSSDSAVFVCPLCA